jgi:Cap4 dsDNA endonuclease
MQFQAAAFASLEILSGKEVDRVYCDYHDDFVVRRNIDGVIAYHFFQVKTKRKANQQWKVDEVFSLKKTGSLDTNDKLNAIRNSIAGRLYVHTIAFADECREVTLLSNIHFHDDVNEIVDHVKKGVSNRQYIQQFIEKFGAIFSPDVSLTVKQLDAARSKLTLMPNVQHMGDTLEAFTDATRNAIWKHSEIDLQKHEVDEIAISLLSLVQSKSCAPIQVFSKEKIDELASIGLEDLLNVLSISTEVYKNLLKGDDPAVIKLASILQRKLKAAGASDTMIETASREKVSWDVWLRTARHTFPDFTIDALLIDIDNNCTSWLLSGGRLADLPNIIENMRSSPWGVKFPSLSDELLFGGFCASIVRRAAQ